MKEKSRLAVTSGAAKRHAKRLGRMLGSQGHSENLEASARLFGFGSWKELLRAEERGGDARLALSPETAAGCAARLASMMEKAGRQGFRPEAALAEALGFGSAEALAEALASGGELRRAWPTTASGSADFGFGAGPAHAEALAKAFEGGRFGPEAFAAALEALPEGSSASIQAGDRVSVQGAGRLFAAGAPISKDQAREAAQLLAGEAKLGSVESGRDEEGSFEAGGAKVRWGACLISAEGSVGVALWIKKEASRAPRLSELLNPRLRGSIPSMLPERGLVLVGGPTASGKWTLCLSIHGELEACGRRSALLGQEASGAEASEGSASVGMEIRGLASLESALEQSRRTLVVARVNATGASDALLRCVRCLESSGRPSACAEVVEATRCALSTLLARGADGRFHALQGFVDLDAAARREIAADPKLSSGRWDLSKLGRGRELFDASRPEASGRAEALRLSELGLLGERERTWFGID